MRPLAELLAAFALLTRLPVPMRRAAPFGHGVWAFPIVGAVVGTFAAGVYALCYRVGMPPLLSSVWAVTASVLATGGLHEDGLADTVDGFGGGATAARKLEIMRDSRIGSYGALALMLSLIVRIAALTALAHPFHVLIAFIVAASCGRAAMVVPLCLLQPARSQGLSRTAASPPLASVVVAVASGPLIAFALMPLALAGRAVAGTSAVALLLTWAARRQIAGHTGDVLGATSVVTETVVLSLTVITVHRA